MHAHLPAFAPPASGPLPRLPAAVALALALTGAALGAGCEDPGASQPAAKPADAPTDAPAAPASAPASQPADPEGPEDITRVLAYHMNPNASGKTPGPCLTAVDRLGRLCGQRGEPVTLSAQQRERFFAFLKDTANFAPPKRERCWAPRHGFLLHAGNDELVGWIDLSLVCMRIDTADRRGVAIGTKGEMYNALSPTGRSRMIALLQELGLPVDPLVLEQAKAEPGAPPAEAPTAPEAPAPPGQAPPADPGAAGK